MGTGEAGAPMKAAKNLAAQDQQTAPTSYPEWTAAFQAYYNSGGVQPPPGYFPSSVVSGPQPNPYLWGGQPMMPPYGTPPPYAALYSHGGIYAHPPIPPASHHYSQFGMSSPGGLSDASMMKPVGGEMDVSRGTDTNNDRSPLKPSKGSLGSLGTGKGGSCGKGNSGSANGVLNGFSPSSGESASDGSSEGSEENNSQDVISALLCCASSNSLELSSSAAWVRPAEVTLNFESSDFTAWLLQEIQETLSIMFLQETSNELLNAL